MTLMAPPRKTIDELPEQGAYEASNFLIVQDSGVTKKMAASLLVDQPGTPLADHLADLSDAHDASSISATTSGPGVDGADVQAQLGQLASIADSSTNGLAAHLADTDDAHDASAISAVPHTGVDGTDVQTQLEQLATALSVKDVVWVGPDAPTDPVIEMWWDSNEESAYIPTVPTDYVHAVPSTSEGGRNISAQSPGVVLGTNVDSAVVFGGTTSNPNTIGNDIALGAILGGYDHEIAAGIASTIVGGGHHVADATDGHTFIGGGSTQIVHGGYGVAVGGLQNTSHSGPYNTVGGGRLNAAGVVGDVTRTDATVSGGYQNTASGIHSSVGGGQLNTASGVDSRVGGGRSNSASGLNATVGGGVSNTTVGPNGTVVGGSSNAASGDYAVAGGGGCAASAQHTVAFGDSNTASGLGSVALGRRAVAALDGKLTYANQQFAAVGDAQVSTIVAKVRTTTATPVGVGLSGISGSGPIVIPDNTTWLFNASIVARRTDADNESAGFTASGVIDRNTGVATTALVAAVTPTVVARDVAAWTVAVTADTTNGALKFTVTGEAAKTIYWVARIELTEVTG
jgi:hypothetical protein